jgi:hypothetical protein
MNIYKLLQRENRGREGEKRNENGKICPLVYSGFT